MQSSPRKRRSLNVLSLLVGQVAHQPVAIDGDAQAHQAGLQGSEELHVGVQAATYRCPEPRRLGGDQGVLGVGGAPGAEQRVARRAPEHAVDHEGGAHGVVPGRCGRPRRVEGQAINFSSAAALMLVAVHLRLVWYRELWSSRFLRPTIAYPPRRRDDAPLAQR